MNSSKITITFDGSVIEADPSKSVLDNLLEQGVAATFSCKEGLCQSCMLRTDDEVSAKSQEGLKPTQVEQGYFLACQARPQSDMAVYSADQASLFQDARVLDIRRLSGGVAQIFVEPAERLDFKAGQFINVKGPDGDVRSYSIATASHDPSGQLEIHVKKHEFGKVSGWLGNQLGVGDVVPVSGANGECFYVKGDLDQPLLLIGTGTGLAPLLGVVRDALHYGHNGPIKLYHGAVDAAGLYMGDELNALAAAYDNLEVILGVLSDPAGDDLPTGPIHEIALADHSDLSGWRVYLSGDPGMVKAAKMAAYLGKAAMSDIFSDPFEVQTPS